MCTHWYASPESGISIPRNTEHAALVRQTIRACRTGLAQWNRLHADQEIRRRLCLRKRQSRHRATYPCGAQALDTRVERKGELTAGVIRISGRGHLTIHGLGVYVQLDARWFL